MKIHFEIAPELYGPAIGAWPTRKGAKLLPHKSDGGAAAAQKQEAERQARIKAAVEAINQTFAGAGRNVMYDNQKQAVYDINSKSVNDQYADTERAARFGLARNGLLGGSEDIDTHAALQEKTNEGLIKAAGLGDEAASNLKKADESSKQTLISMAQSGIDTGTAQSMALNNLNANAQAAAGQSAGASLGGLFNDLNKAYLTNQYMSGMKNGWNTPWTPGSSVGSGSTGSIFK